MYDDNTYSDEPDRQYEPDVVRGAFGEVIELRHYPSLVGNRPRIVLDLSEHEDGLTAHLELDQAKLLLDWLWAEVTLAEAAT